MEADYVVVGAGSAGCAMAFRLAEAGRDVLVIEHGGTDAGPFINMPGALSYPMNMRRYDWGYRTEPEPHLNGRRLAAPRGKVVGGSSSINGMIYVRGHARDFDHWAEAGADGWAFADILPYYKRLEDWHDGGRGGDPAWRGQGGPLHVTRGPGLNPLVQAFIEAGVQAGYQRTYDYNGERQEGFGPFDATIWKGRRWSAASAYLRPAQKLGARLHRAFVRRVLIEGGRAVGVEVSEGARIRAIRARREVILAASAFNSPKILMLSGIGPAGHLKEHGIEVVADRPGVGRNLQDHLELYVQMAANAPESLYRHWSLLGKARVGLQWVLGRRGVGASNQFEAAGFIRSRAGIDYPDIQFHFLPIAVRYDGTGAQEGFQAHVGPMRSKSRGAVSLASPDPAVPPRILFNYMSHPDDWAEFRACIRLTREIFSQPSFARYNAVEAIPGAAKTSDEDLDAAIAEHAESAYHPCGTCRMGRPSDPDTVVDPEGRVVGVSGMRVADSSIFPRVTNGNLNAPSILVGEKIADHVLGRDPLPPENAEPWIHPDWQRMQR